MKKLKLSLLIILIISMLCGSILTVNAAPTNKGLTFTNTDVYRSASGEIVMPSTYEATVYFPSNTSSSTRGGNVVGTYTGATKTCFNFEIHQNGNPRIYIIDADNVARDVKFSNVNVYTGSPLHIAITADYSTGTFKCYINGELKQTETIQSFSIKNYTGTVCLGGDLRSDNSVYFKGTIQNVALYSDIRTASEIASDATATTPATDKLTVAYDLTGYTAGEFPATVNAIKGPALNYKKVQLFFDNRTPVAAADYSFALVGDIQTLNVSYGSQLPKLFDWLIANKDSKKIAHVFHLGDITDKDTADEWKRAVEQYNRLNGVIPYSFVRGNHDGIAKYNAYMNWDDFKHTTDGAYEKAMYNTYKKIAVGGLKYLIINLDLTASDLVLDWANELVEAHPDYNVIVTTHIYLSAAGERTTYIKYNAKNSAEAVWEKFISKHKNIVMVFCGHSPTDQIQVTKAKGVNGNEVTQILVDPQTTDKTYKAAGLVALLHFSSGGKNVEVEYYATIKEKYFLETNQFSFEVNTIAPDPNSTDGVIVDDNSSNNDGDNVSTDADDNNSSNKKKPTNKNNGEASSNVGLIIGIIAVVVVALGAGVVVFFLVYTKKGKKNKVPSEATDEVPVEATPEPSDEENGEEK